MIRNIIENAKCNLPCELAATCKCKVLLLLGVRTAKHELAVWLVAPPHCRTPCTFIIIIFTTAYLLFAFVCLLWAWLCQEVWKAIATNFWHSVFDARNIYTWLRLIWLWKNAKCNWPRVSWWMQSFILAGSAQCKMHCAHPCHAAHTHTHVAYSLVA